MRYEPSRQVSFACEHALMVAMDNLDGKRVMHLNNALREYLAKREVKAPATPPMDVVSALEPSKRKSRVLLPAERARLNREYPTFKEISGPLIALAFTPFPSPEDVAAQAEMDRLLD